jgi:thioredoxin 1
MPKPYLSSEPARSELDHSRGPVLIEFGAAWCGICQSAQPAITQALSSHLGIQHFKVADGPGQPLGRSFGIKLWPTLVALFDGEEVARLVHPTSQQSIEQMLSSITRSS